jgi:membrane associated rhomboid family serine protease
MNNFRPQGFSILPLVTKNLLILNGLVFLAGLTLQNIFNYDVNGHLGLYYVGSEHFLPVQFVTYMFLHGSFSHLLFNMFAFWMFGSAIENLWGPKRFLIYYLATGIGAAIIQQIVGFVRLETIATSVDPQSMQQMLSEGKDILYSGRNWVGALGDMNLIYNIPTVGASGSVFGILLAFGMLFPNSLIYLYFAIPVKAKWFVIGYGVLELYSGFANNPGDNVAHFAHLGGMLFGYLLIKYWKKNDNTYQKFY